MGLFKRRQSPRGPVGPDDHLPLRQDQAQRLRALVRETFAEHGLEVVIQPDHLIDAEGRRLGLWNLAALCNDVPESEWPAVVQAHVATLVDPEDLESLTEDHLLECTHLRLVERAAVPGPDWHPRATALGDSLLVLLSVDRPDSVSTPREDYWEERGGLERWRATGRANLLAVALSDDLVHKRLAPDDGSGAFHVVAGDSFFTASTALELDTVVRRFSPGPESPYGVLVAVPFRHQVAWRVLDGTQDSAVALTHLLRFALTGFAEAPGPLSPHVYWVCDNVWHQVSRVVDGQPTLEITEDLAAALGMAA
jgi:hypothetical protein